MEIKLIVAIMAGIVGFVVWVFIQTKNEPYSAKRFWAVAFLLSGGLALASLGKGLGLWLVS